MSSRRLLAQSQNYKISHEHETVFLVRLHSHSPETIIGDFYGDPEAAIIDVQERFVIMVGCGLIVYYLNEPFEPYEYQKQTTQWRELFREPGKELWVENITQESTDIFHFTVDFNSDNGGLYELVFPHLTTRKLR